MSWKTISGDTIVEQNETYKTIVTIQRTSGSSTDNEVIHALETSVSYSDLEDQLRNQYGTDVEIIKVSARKTGENLYEQTIEFKCLSSGTPPLVVIAIFFVGSIILALIIRDILIHAEEYDLFKIKVAGIEANLFPIIIIAIAIVAILILLRR